MPPSFWTRTSAPVSECPAPDPSCPLYLSSEGYISGTHPSPILAIEALLTGHEGTSSDSLGPRIGYPHCPYLSSDRISALSCTQAQDGSFLLGSCSLGMGCMLGSCGFSLSTLHFLSFCYPTPIINTEIVYLAGIITIKYYNDDITWGPSVSLQDSRLQARHR